MYCILQYMDVDVDTISILHVIYRGTDKPSPGVRGSGGQSIGQGLLQVTYCVLCRGAAYPRSRAVIAGS